MNRAIKYRAYPTPKQEEFFAKTFGCCRKVWNLMLSDKIASYENTKSFGKQTPAMYKDEYPYLREVDSLALANVQLDLQEAMKNAFDKTRKKLNRFPRYKSAKHSRRAYTTNNQKGTVAITENGIKLPKVGIVKAKLHRPPPDEWKLKSATVSQEPDGKFYISVLFEYEREVRFISKDTDNVIGLDYKSDGLYMDSNHIVGSNHKYFRESSKKLAKAQRKLSRMTKGSSNYIKQKAKIAKIHRHIANQRLDNLHKKSTEIANRYDIVCVENLNMRAMSNKEFGNGLATMDNGYGMFLDFLEYKLADRGKFFVKVDKWYPSSQICSHCGRRKKLDLKERVYRCECGLEIDRDYNAAINIRNEGMRILMQRAA